MISFPLPNNFFLREFYLVRLQRFHSFPELFVMSRHNNLAVVIGSAIGARSVF